jgi:hypothetical protein
LAADRTAASTPNPVKSFLAKFKMDPTVGAALLAALTTLFALLAAFGGADIARRNHQGLLVSALVLVLVGFLLGALALIAPSGAQPWVAAPGIFLLVLGLGLAGWSALDHHSGRPLVSASLIDTPTRHIEVKIQRDGLGASDQMEADVGIFADLDANTTPLATVYRASVGPDESGKIDLNFQVPVPTVEKARTVLIRTWVTGKDPPADLSCATTYRKKLSKELRDNAASCVLIVLPTPAPK